MILNSIILANMWYTHHTHVHNSPKTTGYNKRDKWCYVGPVAYKGLVLFYFSLWHWS